MLIRPEIPKDLKEQLYQLSRDKARQGVGGGKEGLRLHQPTPQTSDSFILQARPSKVYVERKTIMGFLNANTYIPFSAQTLNKKFIKPFYKICSENGVEHTLV